MPPRIFIHAVNVHQGGGASLLSAIIEALPQNKTAVLLLDSRMQLPENFNFDEILIKRVNPKVTQRFLSEIWLLNNVTQEDTVLCFGNLPPLFRLRGFVTVFVQNRYLIDDVELAQLPIKTKLRLKIERFWLLNKVNIVDQFLVQTPSMQKLMANKVKNDVLVLPFIGCSNGYKRKFSHNSQFKKDFLFVYVASGESHKNHLRLIEAWILLASEGYFPALKLTLNPDSFQSLCSWITHKKELHKLFVENLGVLKHSQILEQYSQADALIYPSTLESFGLPLIEARQAGLKIIASELDYVRDLLDPEEVFDPNSAISISRAVKRFMGINEPPLPLIGASEFLEFILKKAE